MAIQIKNQLYQPVPITDGNGNNIVLAKREKVIIDNIDIENLPLNIKGLIAKEYIKVKEL